MQLVAGRKQVSYDEELVQSEPKSCPGSRWEIKITNRHDSKRNGESNEQLFSKMMATQLPKPNIETDTKTCLPGYLTESVSNLHIQLQGQSRIIQVQI